MKPMAQSPSQSPLVPFDRRSDLLPLGAALFGVMLPAMMPASVSAQSTPPATQSAPPSTQSAPAATQSAPPATQSAPPAAAQSTPAEVTLPTVKVKDAREPQSTGYQG